MVQRLTTALVDDLDRASPADETVHFALDGKDYEIDLTSPHAAEFRSLLNGYVGAARRANRRNLKAV